MMYFVHPSTPRREVPSMQDRHILDSMRIEARESHRLAVPHARDALVYQAHVRGAWYESMEIELYHYCSASYDEDLQEYRSSLDYARAYRAACASIRRVWEPADYPIIEPAPLFRGPSGPDWDWVDSAPLGVRAACQRLRAGYDVSPAERKLLAQWRPTSDLLEVCDLADLIELSIERAA